jgi:uncharacterized membrane protein
MKRWRCMVCGYIHSAIEPPEVCPVCKAPQNMFVEIDEQGNKIIPSGEKTNQKLQTDSGPQDSYPAPKTDKLASFVQRYHLHPILAHTPNGIIPVIILFMMLGIILNFRSFEQAAFYNLVIVLLAMPGVIITGYLEWKRRYLGAKTILFITKIICSLVVFASLLILAGWKFLSPEVTDSNSPTKWLYLFVNMIMLVAVGIAGHIGGKLVFGSRDK